jgi:4-amino-4-deoxy-L-arabinose transferase-like glycosyltransferase
MSQEKIIQRVFLGCSIGIIFIYALYMLFISSSKVVNIWDEAIYANNSLEMYLNKSYLIYTVNNVPDYYNTKPPLALYSHVVSYHIFGVNVFALRFSSYLSLFVIIISLIYFSIKHFNSLSIGIVASMIYVTTIGVMRQHVFYTADLDAILCVFINFIVLLRLRQLVKGKINNSEIYLTAILFALAYLTKSLASMFIVLPLICSYIINKDFVALLKNKHAYRALFLFLAIAFSYYLVRIPVDREFWNVVWQSEYKRLLYNVMPWITSPWYHYFQTLWTEFFKYQLILLALFGIGYFFLPIKNSIIQKCIIHLLLLCLGYILFLCIPDSKMDFYLAPLYTSFAIIISFLIYEFYNNYKSRFALNEYKMILMAFLLFLYPAYTTAFETRRYAEPLLDQERDAHLLREAITNNPSLRNLKVIGFYDPMYERHRDVLHYYEKLYKLNKNIDISIVQSISDIKLHDTIIVNQQPFKDSLINSSDFKILESQQNAFLLTRIAKVY